MKKLITILILMALGYAAWQHYISPDSPIAVTHQTDNRSIEKAFEKKLSGIQVTGHGTVLEILRDDLKGSRHQRFIVKLPSGQTVLIAHNIDIAPRVRSLKKGEPVSFAGEYEWNNKGGVIHWTHHDPRRTHPPGWIIFLGEKYE